MMEINCHSFRLYPAKVLRKIGIIMEDEEKEDIITQSEHNPEEASPRPSPKGEGEQLARFPLGFRDIIP